MPRRAETRSNGEMLTRCSGAAVRATELLTRNGPPDLILCDVMMPELDGYGVLEQLRTEDATMRIPFVFLTATGEWQDLRTGMNLGADDRKLCNAAVSRAVSQRPVGVARILVFQRFDLSRRAD